MSTNQIKEGVAKFKSVFTSLKDDVIVYCREQGLPERELAWFEKCIEHNTLGGKFTRGLSVIDTATILLGHDLVEEDYFKAATLGWILELQHGFFLMADDILDNAITRRGSSCWYRVPRVGLIAINDACLLESCMYFLLKKHLRQEPYYVDVVELLHQVTFQTEIAEACDLLTGNEEKVNLHHFNMENYHFIATGKTAYYSFYLPVVVALYFCQLATPKNLQQCKDFLLPLGEYYSIQDDYMDNYCDPEVIGKIGTDIPDAKCSWLVNQALLRASPEQRKILEENYGQKDKACEMRVKQLYNELQLDKLYHEFEKKRIQEFRQMIDQVDESEGLRKQVFEEFLRKIYKRNK